MSPCKVKVFLFVYALEFNHYAREDYIPEKLYTFFKLS